MLLFVSIAGYSQYNIDKTNKKVTTTKTEKPEPVKTDWNFEDKDGVLYPVYISNNGCCFVYKPNKKGEAKKYYLGKETSLEICNELGVEYKPKKK